MPSGRLAILIPTYNGGPLLRETVESCANTDLPPDQYEVLVLDNSSTDGSADTLPAQDRKGAKVQVIRNEVNVGRIGNWNCALSTAAERGFAFVAFLFVGDCYVHEAPLGLILNKMCATGALLALARFQIVDEAGGNIYQANRFTFDTHMSMVSTPHLLRTFVSSGAIPLAPLQANIYRLESSSPLLFDEGNPENTDIDATVDYLLAHGRPVLLEHRPVVAWRVHSGRFFVSSSGARFVEKTYASLARLAALIDVPYNPRRVASALLVHQLAATALLNLKRKPYFEQLKSIAAVLRQHKQARLLDVIRIIGNKLLKGRSSVHIHEERQELGSST